MGSCIEYKNGISFYHNSRADPHLDISKLAVRRIPCLCDACTEQIKLPCNHDTTFNDQPQYKNGNVQCKY